MVEFDEKRHIAEQMRNAMDFKSEEIREERRRDMFERDAELTVRYWYQD